MSGRALAAVGGIVTLGGWLAGSLGFWRGPSPAPQAAASPDGPPAIAQSAESVRSGVQRLLARPTRPERLASPTRNPFRFSERQPAPGPVSIRELAGADVPPLVEAASLLRLIGLAEDPGPDGPRRTAIISGLDQLFFVKAGDEFGGHFRVLAVSGDAARVEDTTTRAVITLAMR